jgi:hypothetical protein
MNLKPDPQNLNPKPQTLNRSLIFLQALVRAWRRKGGGARGAREVGSLTTSLTFDVI